MFDFIKKENYILDEKTEKNLLIFRELLKEWNNKFNLTTITSDTDVEIKHFLDSIKGESYFPKNSKCIEIGSGGGFPSIPLMIYRSDLSFTLVESVGKKCTFLQEVINKLSLNAVVINKRAEDIGKNKNFRENFDVVTARAVAKLNTLSEYCIPLIKEDGLFISYKGETDEEDIGKNAIKVLGGKMIEKVEYLLPNDYGKRRIYVIKKVEKTPEKYPRGNGKERSKPL